MAIVIATFLFLGLKNITKFLLEFSFSTILYLYILRFLVNLLTPCKNNRIYFLIKNFTDLIISPFKIVLDKINNPIVENIFLVLFVSTLHTILIVPSSIKLTLFSLLYKSFIQILLYTINLYNFIIIVYIVFEWMESEQTSLFEAIFFLLNPITKKIRQKFSPISKKVDISYLFLIFALNIIKVFLNAVSI